MSHDQKPARMRVVSGGTPAAQRRRGDETAQGTGTTAVAATGVGAAASGARAAGGAKAGKAAGKSGVPAMVLVALFVVGCAAGGAALPLLGLL